MDIPLVVDFMRSARFMSWSEDGWAEVASIGAIREAMENVAD
jgi:hypothetical protein